MANKSTDVHDVMEQLILKMLFDNKKINTTTYNKVKEQLQRRNKEVA